MLQRYLHLYFSVIFFLLNAAIHLFKAGHFGKPAQPYAAESLAWLRELILGKKVYVKLLRRDQYSRIVSVKKGHFVIAFHSLPTGCSSFPFPPNIARIFFPWQESPRRNVEIRVGGNLRTGKDLTPYRLRSLTMPRPGWCRIRKVGKRGLPSTRSGIEVSSAIAYPLPALTPIQGCT